MECVSVVIRLKVPTEMHYTVISMGTSKVNSSAVFRRKYYQMTDLNILSKGKNV